MKLIRSQDNKQLINTNETQRFQISRIAKTSITPSRGYRYTYARSWEPVELTPENSIYSIEADNYTIASYTTEEQAQYVLDEILFFLTSNKDNNLFTMPINLGANYTL